MCQGLEECLKGQGHLPGSWQMLCKVKSAIGILCSPDLAYWVHPLWPYPRFLKELQKKDTLIELQGYL